MEAPLVVPRLSVCVAHARTRVPGLCLVFGYMPSLRISREQLRWDDQVRPPPHTPAPSPYTACCCHAS